ncbi:MAG: hypothetical protein AB7G47_10125 [Mycolicibacterium sp.]|uniref:hypothetical protein n=1 Tax=Mycolicibacterium sp. TaxID=2320850 RepID=UPI003D0A7CA7
MAFLLSFMGNSFQSRPGPGVGQSRYDLHAKCALFERRDVEFPPRVEEWRTWQFAQSLSPRTVDERSGAVMRMSESLQTDPEVVQPSQIAHWLAHGGDWTPRTRWRLDPADTVDVPPAAQCVVRLASCSRSTAKTTRC